MVGGVSAVKVLKFFQGMDWGRLERKEIEPPEILELDGDHDLRHFYDEFTNMKLPRSVKEISEENFKPRRCESNMFRGFSYIQEDFVLPERSDHQQEHYWNNIDEDGESRSDCASSKFGDDDNDFLSEPQSTTLESTPESEEPIVPAKKKRVRKKKKKKPAETGGEREATDNANGCTTTSTTTTTTTTTTTADEVMQTEIQRQLEETKREKSNDTPQSNNDTSEAHTVPIASNGHPPQRAAPQSIPVTPAISTPKPTTRVERPPPPTWETVGSNKPSSRTIQAPNKLAPRTIQAPNKPAPAPALAQQTHQPKQQRLAAPTRWSVVPTATPKKITPPQTWATVGKQKTMPSRATGAARGFPVTDKTTNSVATGWGRPGVCNTTASSVGTEIGMKKPETSGNWREHKMSRGVSGGARHKNDEAGPTPMQTEFWPTLGGSKVGSSSTTSAAPKVGLGRWGSKNAGTNVKKSPR